MIADPEFVRVPMPKRRQIDRVRDQLHYDRAAGHGTCGSTFASMFILRYGARVWELIHDEGCVIEVRPCHRHPHDGPIGDHLLVFDPKTDQPKQLSLSLAS